MVRGYLDYQYSSAERAEHREANAARQARWRGQSRAPAVTITPDPLDLVAARNGVTEESVTALVTRQVVKDLKQDPLEGSLAVNPGGAAMRLEGADLAALSLCRPLIRAALDRIAQTGDTDAIAVVHATGTARERALVESLLPDLQLPPPRDTGWTD